MFELDVRTGSVVGASLRRRWSVQVDFVRVLSLICAMFFAPLSEARSEVVLASPDAFEIRASVEVNDPVDYVWRALFGIERWWNDEHTFSGDAANMRLDPVSGGCWCERWGQGQSVEHARVVLVMINGNTRSIRLDGALGPLQAVGARGILTFIVAPQGGRSRISVTYLVSGSSYMQLDALAPAVSEVLDAQLHGLVRALSLQQ